MPDIICNTSPLQYLHQIGRLGLLPHLVSRIVVPAAVAGELAEGRRLGMDLPIPESLPFPIDDLQVLGFRLSKQTREAILRLAGEA